MANTGVSMKSDLNFSTIWLDRSQPLFFFVPQEFSQSSWHDYYMATFSSFLFFYNSSFLPLVLELASTCCFNRNVCSKNVKHFFNMWSNILYDLNGSQGLIKPNKRLLLNTCGCYYRWTEEVPHPN